MAVSRKKKDRLTEEFFQFFGMSRIMYQTSRKTGSKETYCIRSMDGHAVKGLFFDFFIRKIYQFPVYTRCLKCLLKLHQKYFFRFCKAIKICGRILIRKKLKCTYAPAKGSIPKLLGPVCPEKPFMCKWIGNAYLIDG